MLNYLSMLRIRHWVKNLFLFAAPFFGGALFTGETIHNAFPAFLAFSLCASAGYILNDIRDVKNDRLHPQKQARPIASGAVSGTKASMFAVLLAGVSFALSFGIARTFLLYVLSYFFIQVLYSLYLKHIAVIDIFCIASGFVIRVLAGGAAFNVDVSSWLFLTMFMISLVLATGKRLGEISLLNNRAEDHRKSLGHYSSGLLNEILLVASSASLITYALYTVEQFHRFVYTIPVVTLGLFRYLMLSKQGMGDPTEAMTKDKWLAVTVMIWLALVGIMRYSGS